MESFDGGEDLGRPPPLAMLRYKASSSTAGEGGTEGDFLVLGGRLGTGVCTAARTGRSSIEGEGEGAAGTRGGEGGAEWRTNERVARRRR